VPEMVSSVQLSAATGEVNPWVNLNYWKAESGIDLFPGVPQEIRFSIFWFKSLVSALQSKLIFVLLQCTVPFSFLAVLSLCNHENWRSRI
jgi:hypothetical protein